VFAEDVGGSGHLNGGVALAPDPAWKFDVEEAQKAPPADVNYRARSSLTRLVAITVREYLMARRFFNV
jgi:hypothetical protein